MPPPWGKGDATGYFAHLLCPDLLNILGPAPLLIQWYWSESSSELCQSIVTSLWALICLSHWCWAWLTFILQPASLHWLAQSCCYIWASAEHLTKLMRKIRKAPITLKCFWNVRKIASLFSSQTSLPSFPFVLNSEVILRMRLKSACGEHLFLLHSLRFHRAWSIYSFGDFYFRKQN